nr:hypothetical protein [Mycobacterium sp. E3298]
MSHTEYKTVIRAKIEGLEGKSKNEVYEFFKDILGEAKWIDEYDGEIERFSYEDKPGNFVAIQEYKSKQWGVDYILAHGSDYSDGSDVNLSMEEIGGCCRLLNEKFGVKESECRLVSYSWYNGGDEPINF